ncbi:MAG: DUF4384 domain-containing protein, partial [Acidimicrobiia bacterium]
MIETIKRAVAIIASVAAMLHMTLSASSGPRPQADDQTRRIVAEEFLKQRPSKPGTKEGKRPSYERVPGKPTGPTGATVPAGAAVEIGLTIWRLRPASAADEGARLLVQEGSKSSEWTPERIEAQTPLMLGERVRLSIESSRSGYLYVIDREQYADGSQGEPYLIFPTTRTRGGDNKVKAGRLIDIPGQQDRPNFFTVKPERPEQVGEMLTLLVTSKPLEGVTIGSAPLKLSAAQVKTWEQQWGGTTELFE